MCTVVILRRSGDDWPVLLAANRDEMIDRPWKPPARHWPELPGVVAGLDQLAGGSWLGVNDHGVVAAMLNRQGSLGPAAGKRSRGLLTLDALAYEDAAKATLVITGQDPGAYRSFNMIIADARSVHWLRLEDGADLIEAMDVPEGFSMLTAYDLNDARSGRIRTHLPKFEETRLPDPDKGKWSAWEKLMQSRDGGGDGVENDMLIESTIGFGTTSSSFIALPSAKHARATPTWLFAAGRPDRAPYESVRF